MILPIPRCDRLIRPDTDVMLLIKTR